MNWEGAAYTGAMIILTRHLQSLHPEKSDLVMIEGDGAASRAQVWVQAQVRD